MDTWYSSRRVVSRSAVVKRGTGVGVQAVLVKVSVVEHVVEYDGGTLFPEWIETDKERIISGEPDGYVIQLEESLQSVGES